MNGLITWWRFSMFYYLLRKCDELLLSVLRTELIAGRDEVCRTIIQLQKKMSKSSCPEVFLRKDILKICGKFTGDYPYRSAISIKLLWNFIEITIRLGYSPVNLLHISITPFYKNTSGWLLLKWILAIRISENIWLNSRTKKVLN